jgi:hypothetical protein
VENQQGVAVLQRHIEVRVQFLGFALELALPFRGGGAGSFATESKRILPDLGFHAV